MLPSRIFFDDLFNDFDAPRSSKLDSMMKCDVYEKDGKFNIEMDVPGFKKEDVNISLENGYLTISAEKNVDEDNNDDKKYIRRERHVHQSCERQFYVGDVDETLIKAEFKNGTLLISVPKEEKKRETKKLISID